MPVSATMLPEELGLSTVKRRDDPPFEIVSSPDPGPEIVTGAVIASAPDVNVIVLAVPNTLLSKTILPNPTAASSATALRRLPVPPSAVVVTVNAGTGPPARSTINVPVGEPIPVTRSYPGPAENAPLEPLVMSWKSGSMGVEP